MKIVKKYILPIALVGLLLAIDQVTKRLAVRFLRPVGTFELVYGLFSLHYAENSGMAFGLFQGGRWVFVALTVVVLGFIVYLYATLPKTRFRTPMRFFLLVLIGGALGNFVDRLFQGYVVDFLAFTFVNFPVFNMADVFLVVSVFALVPLFLISESKGKNSKGKSKLNLKSNE